MKSLNQWQPDEYDSKLAFVSGYGKNLISWLQPQKGEYILDLGCGTGDLTHEISLTGAEVIGMDASTDMIRRARRNSLNLSLWKETVISLRQIDCMMPSSPMQPCTGCEARD